MSRDLDRLDQQLLNEIQASFPLVRRPFDELATRLDTTPEDVMARLRRLKDERFIRQISAIFDTRTLGYKSSLVAMKVAPDRLDAVAQIINEHPGVSHNYRRNHEYNLWFTIAVPPDRDVAATVDRLHDLVGAEVTRLLPTLTLFKIGVELDMTGEQSLTRTRSPQYYEGKRIEGLKHTLTDQDVAVIRELQVDLPIEPEPFTPMAERAGLSLDEFFAHAQTMIEKGQLRRFAAILFHRRAGYRANAMGVWAVPEDQVAGIGPQMASFAAVSHCYQRPIYEDWPYNVFTMIHGRSMEDCETIIDAIADATGIRDYAVLYSTKEYKKTRVAYFSPDWDDWEARIEEKSRGLAAPVR